MRTANRTAEEKAAAARSFDHQSARAYLEVKIQLSCNCEPYKDVYTLPRWNGQGFKIKKGSRAIRKTVFIPFQTVTADGRVTTATRPKTTLIFCRCQVEPYKNIGGNENV